MVDQRTGRVLNAPQLGWRDVDVRDALAEATGFDVHIENAPIACALAQMWLGERGDDAPRDFVYVTVSDGVGAGVVVNGEVVRGHNNTGRRVRARADRSRTGPHVSVRRARLPRGVHVEPRDAVALPRPRVLADARRACCCTSPGSRSPTSSRVRATGDARAVDALEETARHLGGGLAVIINTLNPAQIFVGGEITEAWDRRLTR